MTTFRYIWAGIQVLAFATLIYLGFQQQNNVVICISSILIGIVAHPIMTLITKVVRHNIAYWRHRI